MEVELEEVFCILGSGFLKVDYGFLKVDCKIVGFVVDLCVVVCLWLCKWSDFFFENIVLMESFWKFVLCFVVELCCLFFCLEIMVLLDNIGVLCDVMFLFWSFRCGILGDRVWLEFLIWFFFFFLLILIILWFLIFLNCGVCCFDY